jgi:hypothetical protein
MSIDASALDPEGFLGIWVVTDEKKLKISIDVPDQVY